MNLALKYRPKRFEDLIGQETVSTTLSLALDSKRLSHAYLFSGLRGSGKTSTARIFAKALICEKGETSSPCEECQNCISANEGRHIDIIEMDAASNRKIDDIRDLIEQTKYAPSIARYKIFIIDEVHMLTREAFNALLKTLEEPPSYVKFILATTDPLKLPATILSRTQHFSFKRISTNNIFHHLQFILNNEKIEYEDDALEILSRSGNGSLRDTLTLLDQAIIYSKAKVTTDAVVNMLGILDPKKIEHIFKAILIRDKQALIAFAKEVEEYDSEILIDDMINFLKRKFFENDPEFELFLIERFFRIIAKTKELLALNSDSSFAISLMLFKMLEATKSDEIVTQIQFLSKELQKIEDKEKIAKKPETKTPSLTTHNEAQNLTPTTTLTNDELFKKLIEKLYDRNYSLGECFEKNITFVSFENHQLTWRSNAANECKKMLVTYWSVVKFMVQDVFGSETKIKAIKLEKNPKDEQKHTPPPPPKEEPLEPMPSSCIQSCSGLSETTKEFDNTKILESEFIQRAIKLFDAKKVKIKAKI